MSADYDTASTAQPTLSAYHEFLRLEMPPQMQQQLAMEIEQELTESPEGIDERLRQRLPSIVHTVHRRLFRLFEESRTVVEGAGLSSSRESSGSSSTQQASDTPSIEGFADDALDTWFPMDD